jgi:hypothetical protein
LASWKVSFKDEVQQHMIRILSSMHPSIVSWLNLLYSSSFLFLFWVCLCLVLSFPLACVPSA